MRWFHLEHDFDDDSWSEVTEPERLIYFRDQCEKEESVVAYDGFIWGASVQADTLEKAIERAKELEKKYYEDC